MASATKKARKALNLTRGEEALEVLVASDFRVVQLSPYHFRINERLDVWPSSGRYWNSRTYEKGSFDDLAEFVIAYAARGWRKA